MLNNLNLSPEQRDALCELFIAADFMQQMDAALILCGDEFAEMWMSLDAIILAPAHIVLSAALALVGC